MRTLTARGRGLLIGGVVAAGVGWGVHQPALIAVAVLLALLPVLGAVSVRRSRFLLGSAREVERQQLPFGTQTEVLLTVENGSRLASGSLCLEDDVPPSLGEPARLVLDRIPPRAQRSVRYPISGLARGRATVGPLRVVVADPFGTARHVHEFSSTTSVLVTPRVEPLDGASGVPAAGGRGDASFRSLAARGDDDVLPREHRPGDDMRRIHWRATARQGELMVRREELSWHSSLVVVLDDRAAAHHGAGAASTFEWAVSAAASIAVHHLRRGWQVTVVGTSGRALARAAAATSADLGLLLLALAEVRTVERPASAGLRFDADGTTAVVAILGQVTEDAARLLDRPMSGTASCLLLAPGPEEHLRNRGWRVASWSRHTPIAEAWQHVAPGSAASAHDLAGWAS